MLDLRAIVVTYRVPLLVLIIVAAAVVRLYGIGSEPLWLDEASTAWFSSRSWFYLWTVVPTFENHPPLYYAMLKLWQEFAGSSELALRLPSAVASIATVVVLFLSGRLVGGWPLGLMAAAICAAWRFQILYAGNARAYAIFALGSALLMYGVLRAIRSAGDFEQPPRAFAGTAAARGLIWVAIGMAILLWSHLVGVVPVLAAAGFLVCWWLARGGDRGTFVKLALAGVAAIVLYLPNLPMILALATTDHSGFWLEPPTLRHLAWLTGMTFGQPVLGAGPINLVLAVLLTTAGAVGIWRLGQERGNSLSMLVFLLVMVAGSWLAMVAITYLAQPIMLPRTMIFLQPPAILLMAGIPWAFRRGRTAVTLALLGFMIVGSFRPMPLLHDPRTYKDIARAIAQSDAPDAPVVIIPNFIAVGLDYYGPRFGAEFVQRPYPAPYPAEHGHLGELDEVRTTALLEGLAEAPTVWVMTRRLDSYDPERLVFERLEQQGRRRTVVHDGQDWHETLSRFDRID